MLDDYDEDEEVELVPLEGVLYTAIVRVIMVVLRNSCITCFELLIIHFMSHKDVLVHLTGVESGITIQDHANNTKCLQVIKPSSDSVRWICAEPSYVLEVLDLGSHLYSIGNNRQTCCQWENATKEYDIPELLDQFLVVEEDLWIV